MAYEFKKLSAVEAVETPADTANVLIEENGVIKRVPKGEVGGVKVASTAEVGQTLVVKTIDKNGMPVEWECADAGTQPDWNESDKTSMAYIKNKPFSKKILDTPVVEEQSLNPDDYYGYNHNGIMVYSASLHWQLLPEFVEGKGYAVYFDGTLYELIGSYYNDYYTTYYLGNGSLIYNELPDNLIPFAIYKEYEPEYGSSNYIKFKDNNPHTFSIYEMDLVQIESIYIPKMKSLSIGGIGYDGSKPVKIIPIGRAGNGGCSEVFNNGDAEYTINEANGFFAHAEGYNTKATGEYSHVQGKYNIEDTNNLYAHIIGNGSYNKSSNAHTVDWNGNAWYAGTVECTGVIVKSSTSGSTKRFKITVDDNGTISAAEV